MNKELVQEMIDALEWAAQENIPQWRGEYINPESFHFANALEKCQMCAVGAIYAKFFGDKPLPSTWAYGNDSYIDARSRISAHLNEKYNESVSDIESLEADIVDMNDDNLWSFQRIADQLRFDYLLGEPLEQWKDESNVEN